MLKGGNINAMMAELHGREAGLCKGRGGSSHMMDLEHRNMGANGIIGACASLAAGMALALKMKKSEGHHSLYPGRRSAERRRHP